MGTTGYTYAASLDYRSDEVILDLGGGDSTDFLARVGPPVVMIDVSKSVCRRLAKVSNVVTHLGRAEDVLRNWSQPIGFAWLDGHDWPYTHVPPGTYDEQRADYERRGQSYSQDASLESHLTITRLIVDHVRVVAFDDTWRTHRYHAGDDGRCVEPVPPATQPAPATMLNESYGDVVVCDLEPDHPHHDVPERGWNGKGGTAIPYLLDHQFNVVTHGLTLVVLQRDEDDACHEQF